MPHSNVIDISTRRPREIPNVAERYWDEVEFAQMARKRERRQAKKSADGNVHRSTSLSRKAEGPEANSTLPETLTGHVTCAGASVGASYPHTFRPDWPAVGSWLVFLWAGVL